MPVFSFVAVTATLGESLYLLHRKLIKNGVSNLPMLSAQDRNRLIAAIQSLPDEVEALVASLDDAQLTSHPIEGEWSIAQNVHHLVDSHINSYVRCKLMATEERPSFRPYDEAAWAELPDASSPDISISLALLRALHRRWVVFWRSLTEEQWQRRGYHPGSDRTVSLADQLQIYVEHGRAHMRQIRRNLSEF